MTEHALIMCREPGRHSTLDKGHEEGGSAYPNAGSSLRSPPGYSRASPPQKNGSLPTVLLCALTSDFTGGFPPPPRDNMKFEFNQNENAGPDPLQSSDLLKETPSPTQTKWSYCVFLVG